MKYFHKTVTLLPHTAFMKSLLNSLTMASLSFPKLKFSKVSCTALMLAHDKKKNSLRTKQERKKT